MLSLRKRLLLGAGLCCLLLLVATGVTIERFVVKYLQTEMINEMTVSLDDLIANLDIDATSRQPILSDRLSDPRFQQPYSGHYWQVQSNSRVILRSRSLWDQDLSFNHLSRVNGIVTTETKGPQKDQLLVIQQRIKLPGSQETYWLSVGVQLSNMHKALKNIRGSIYIGLGLMTLGVLMVLAFQLSWGLAPLSQLRKELDRIREGKQENFKGTYPPEISPLTDDINTLVTHYRSLLERARTHTGNLAHALKTPISVMQNDLDADSEPDKALLLSQLNTMRQHVEYQLARARLAGSARILGVSCSPYQQCKNAASAFERLYQTRGLAVNLEADPTLKVAVDAKDFDEMAGNLIENAFKWAQNGLWIHTRASENMVEVYVEDDGPGMTEHECQQALQRGKRIDEHTPGSGLGLSIVTDVVTAYQGRLSLTRSELGGLCACLYLPRQQ